MGAELSGYTQLTAGSGAYVAWPAGAAVGDLAVVTTDGNSSLASRGWTPEQEGVLYRVLTSSDLADDLWVDDTLYGIKTFSGARGIGTVRYRVGSAGVTLTEAGAGLYVHGWGQRWAGDIGPSADMLGTVVDHENYPNAEWWQEHTSTGYKGLGGEDPQATYLSYEILPATVPGAPTVVAPRSGETVDADSPIPVGWVPDGSQTAAKVQLTKVSDSSVLYLLSDGTITGTESTIVGTATTQDITVGELVSGAAYDVRVATANDKGFGPYSPPVRFSPLARPTVNSIGVHFDRGARTPTIYWTMTPGAGAQVGRQARICPEGDATPDNPLWDSGVSPGNSGYLIASPTTPWVNGAQLRAWVRVQDSAYQWSVWTPDDGGFSVSWAAPSAPSSVTAANQADGPLQVSITRGALPVELWWRPEGADDFTLYAKRSGLFPDPVVIDVALAPYGVPVEYRARTVGYADGVEVYSDWAYYYNVPLMENTIASTDRRAYFVADTTVRNYLPIHVVSGGRRVVVQGIAMHYGMGAERARVDKGPAAGFRGTLFLTTHTLAESEALSAWVTEVDVWCVRWNPEARWNDRGTVEAPPTLRVALAEQREWSHRFDPVPTQSRTVPIDWVQQ